MRLNLQLFAKSIEELAKEVIQGKYGNGQARKNALGSNYEAVQSMVNSMLSGSSSTTKKTTTTTAPTTTTPTTTTPVTSTAAPAATPKDFKYEDYEKSDITKQAEALLQQQMANKPGEYQSNWQSQLNETLDKILNKEPFSYDLNGDALYQQYKDQYMTQGKLASMDVMGQAAAMNGGYGSSYGQTVGHQAYQGYLQQLNDRVPELYQLALNQYNQEYQDLKDLYALYTDMDEREYGRYRDKVSDYNTELARLIDEARYQDETGYNRYSDDKTFDYGQFIDSIEYDYKVNRDAISDAETKKKYAYDTAMSMLSLGVTPSAEKLADAGISSADANAIVKKVLANEAVAKAAATASSSGGESGNGNTWADVVKGSGGGSYINESAVNEFSKKVDDYTKNWDAVMRHMWGSPETYIAQQIEEAKLTDTEKAYLISKYGITEMHLNYKKK